MMGTLGTVDLVVFVGAILMTVLIGLYFTRGNKTLDTYMRADGKLSVFPVAMSLMSSCLSGLTMIGSSAEIFYQGPGFSFVWFAMLVSGPIAAITILPVFYDMKELSLHTYLERRFGSSLRNFLSLIYMVQAIFHSAVVMYLPALALESILGLDKIHSILVTGCLCVIYSTLGGIRAVVWTDAFLGLIMMVSLFSFITVGTIDAGGLDKVFALGAEGQRLRLDGFFQFSLTARHTIFGLAIGSTLKHIYMISVNQVQMQRVLSLGTLRQAQWAFIWCSIFAASVSIMSSYIGLIVYSAYRDCDPFIGGEIRRRDALVLHYLALRLSRVPGLQGIFSAGLISGALSAVSSFSNSMAALVIEDFVVPIRAKLNHEPLTNRASMWLAKMLSVSAGALCIIMACAVDKTSPRLLQTVNLLSGAFGVPILAAFAVGIFMRFSNTKGLTVALVSTFSLGAYLAYSQTFHSKPLAPAMPVYFNEQCARIFNRSTSIQEANWIADHLPQSPLKPLPPNPPLELVNLSYMMVPIMMFTIVILVTILVSLITGGDDPDESLLVKALRKKIPTPLGRDIHESPTQTPRRLKLGISHSHNHISGHKRG